MPHCASLRVRVISLKEKKEIAPVVEELKAWRERNGLSQRAAAATLERLGCPVLVGTLQKWEVGYRRPNRWASERIAGVLRKHPAVKDPPKYGKRVLSNGEASEIRALREHGWELEKIAEKFGITGSGVSRVCAGNRHGKTTQTRRAV
jgi:transcriptional regulator with XRE-family HTH domain